MIRPFVKWMLPAMVLVVIAAAEARACPPGTVFSAYGGSGLCVEIGQGRKSNAICDINRKGRRCPVGCIPRHKNSDPTHDYCCPLERNMRCG
jgi:hypothetical protein